MELRDLLERNRLYLYHNPNGFMLTQNTITRIAVHQAEELSEVVPFDIEYMKNISFKFGSGIDYYTVEGINDVLWNSKHPAFYEFIDWMNDGIANLPPKK